MKSKAMSLGVYALLACNLTIAQDAAAPKQMNGTVLSIDTAANQLVMKADSGSEMKVTLAPKHALRKVALGETDLRKAAVIEFKDIAAGDRVAARGTESADQKEIAATLIVVMSSSDVAKKQEADRADWDKRGVNGIVTAVGSESVTLNVRTLAGAKTITVIPTDKATVRRYTADSVKFSDAKESTIAEIKVGDQVRARGDKSDDGSKLNAEEVVSGTFKTIAATVVSIDAANQQMTVKDLETKKPMVVKVNTDSNMKRLSDQMAQMIARRVHPENFEGRGGGRGAAGGGREGGSPPADGGGRQGGGPGGPGGGRGGDLQSMIDRQPAVTIADLKVGEPIVISSAVGRAADHITAITMLAGVEPILRSPGKPEMSLGGWNLGGGGDMGGGN
jgi:hypothetical protein